MRWRDADIRNLVLAQVVGGLFFVLLNGADLHRRCADGWRSPSIGVTGACSHHGGVVSGLTFVPLWRLILPHAAGSLIFLVPAWRSGMFRQGGHAPGEAFASPASTEIRQAIEQGMDLHFLYTKKGGAPQWRTVTPQQLTTLGAGPSSPPCLIGYCHLRQARRTFVLARMDQVTAIARAVQNY
ncbi:WYL domain-containing protein [uncultured Stenotrophomonas sp.]|uniref:WYL domain-containing protein n=1 Tax=uncultured Stenotrophomonas sp. TaxID=165438 RepID=UPI0031F32C76